MNRDDIIRMAKEAGFPDPTISANYFEKLERFFYVAYAEGAKAEREACAKLLDDNWFRTQSECAAAIRARGEQ